MPAAVFLLDGKISIHALRGEGDIVDLFLRFQAADISIHALRGEGDLHFEVILDGRRVFLSTPSVGRATCWRMRSAPSPLFLSTPSVGRATKAMRWLVTPTSISIHALRGEGDCRAPASSRWLCNFYPRPPWGGRRVRPGQDRHAVISIHALRGEGDILVLDNGTEIQAFLSTPSVGRATLMMLVNSKVSRFLSTPSVGRATSLSCYGSC